MDTTNPTLKDVLTSWRDAVSSHSDGRYQDVIDAYSKIPETTARMNYNVACAYMKLGKNEQAIKHMSEAVQIDSHLAIAFFQRGGLYLKSNRPEDAARDFDTTYTLLRGNTHIDYKPLGLFVRLMMSEVLYNRAMCKLQMGDVEAARTLLKEALYCTDAVKADQLRSALNFLEELAPEMVTPLQKSADRVFSPPKQVTDNLEKRAIVGKAKVVATNSTNCTDPMTKAERRVKELLFVPKPRPPSSPGAVFRRFLKSPPRSRSQSTTDLRFSADVLSTPAFLRKKGNGKLRKNKSSSDLPQTPKRDRYWSEGAIFQDPNDRLTPTSPVRGFDILSFTPSNEGISVPTSPNMNKRKSLGSVFGNSSTVVKMGLSLSCDMLTAFVTPCSSEHDSSSLHSDTTSNYSVEDRGYGDEDEAGEITLRVPSVGSSDAGARGSVVSQGSMEVFRENSTSSMSIQEETLTEKDEEDEAGEMSIMAPSVGSSDEGARGSVVSQGSMEVFRENSTRSMSLQEETLTEKDEEDEAGEITLLAPSVGSSDAGARGSVVSQGSIEVFRENSTSSMSLQEETLTEKDEEREGEIHMQLPSVGGSDANVCETLLHEDEGNTSRKSCTSLSSDQDTAINADLPDGRQEIKASNFYISESETESEGDKEVDNLCSIEEPTISTATTSLNAVVIETTKKRRPPPPSYPPPPLPKEVKQSLCV